MPVIEIIGLASKSSSFIEYSSSDMDIILLDWLRSHGVTIASSCDGEGVCKKCGIQNEWLTCELTLKTFLERQPDGKIYIGYL
jgi:Na+-transporting NADH:ubiquinone oxidoreductase subunit NqrF